MGSLPVATIDKALVLKAIQPIWKNKNVTASRTLRLVRGILDYAKVIRWRAVRPDHVLRGGLANGPLRLPSIG